jgi:hypothetical protein
MCSLVFAKSSLGKYVRPLYTSPAAGSAGRRWDKILCGGLNQLASLTAEGPLQ